MPAISNPILEQYAKLTKFLGLALGPDYEVVLHDLTDKNRSIIAIANNHVSGRELGAPLTNMALRILQNRSYETSDFRLHDYGVSADGRELRSNTLFIKQDGRLIGMLCVNFDDSRFRDVSARLMGLCHPDMFVSSVIPKLGDGDPVAPAAPPPPPEKYRNTTEAVARDAIHRELEQLGVSAERLTTEERMRIISALDTGGIFLLKGAVKDTAAELHCSQASVYRYLSQIKSEHADHGEIGPLP